MGRILQDGEDPTQKRRQKVFLHSLFSIVCCMGGKLADVGKRYSKDISRGDKGRTFFSAGWTVWDELTVSPWITTL